MPLEQAPRRDRSSWPILIGLIVVAIGGGTAAFWHWPAAFHAAMPMPDPAPRETAAVEAPKTPVAAAPAAPRETAPVTAVARQEPTVPATPREPTAPTFDIVRITPQGNAVVAGRSEPFAHVTVRDGERVLGEADSDRNGEFVIVPADRVRPGGRELTLSARGPDGREVQGQDTVMVMGAPPSVSEPAVVAAKPAEPMPVAATPTPTPPAPTVTAANEAPLAVLLPHDDAAPRVLQGPNKPRALALNSVDYNQQGDIRFSGSAKPSAPVRVYVDNQPVGETSTDPSGQWTLTPPNTMPAGVHQLRVDELTGGGKVQNRVELPFQRTATPMAGLSPGQTVVQPGANLWRIARQTYGSGARYTVIYLANREQIRDPNRIYPGQVFSMPGEP